MMSSQSYSVYSASAIETFYIFLFFSLFFSFSKIIMCIVHCAQPLIELESCAFAKCIFLFVCILFPISYRYVLCIYIKSFSRTSHRNRIVDEKYIRELTTLKTYNNKGQEMIYTEITEYEKKKKKKNSSSSEREDDD